MSQEPVQAAVAPRGRPRDPSVERRAHAAALQIYAEVGLRGLTFDAVTARTSIGKPALYRRWSSAQELLLAAIASETSELGIRDTGTLRQDLRILAEVVAAEFSQDVGLVAIQLLLDARSRPELYSGVSDTALGTAIRAARDIVPRAVARGELPQGTSPTMLIETLLGGILLRVLTGHLDAAAPPPLDADYLEELIDLCLHGVTRERR